MQTCARFSNTLCACACVCWCVCVYVWVSHKQRTPNRQSMVTERRRENNNSRTKSMRIIFTNTHCGAAVSLMRRFSRGAQEHARRPASPHKSYATREPCCWDANGVRAYFMHLTMASAVEMVAAAAQCDLSTSVWFHDQPSRSAQMQPDICYVPPLSHSCVICSRRRSNARRFIYQTDMSIYSHCISWLMPSTARNLHYKFARICTASRELCEHTNIHKHTRLHFCVVAQVFYRRNAMNPTHR